MQLSLFPDAGFTAHKSGQDESVNWDRPADVGRIEARYVRRCPDYFVVYLSSQTGCAQGCRMCHLTATGQTGLRDATVGEMIEQARTVLDHYRREAAASRWLAASCWRTPTACSGSCRGWPSPCACGPAI